MTTKNSSPAALRVQAESIARVLKAAERGDKIDGPNAHKIVEARLTKPSFKTGIVMDDKVITIDMPWPLIKEYSEEALAAYILAQMQETVADQ